MKMYRVEFTIKQNIAIEAPNHWNIHELEQFALDICTNPSAHKNWDMKCVEYEIGKKSITMDYCNQSETIHYGNNGSVYCACSDMISHPISTENKQKVTCRNCKKTKEYKRAN